MCFHDVYSMWRALLKKDGGEGERPLEIPSKTPNFVLLSLIPTLVRVLIDPPEKGSVWYGLAILLAIWFLAFIIAIRWKHKRKVGDRWAEQRDEEFWPK